jgi:hypothetical protein
VDRPATCAAPVVIGEAHRLASLVIEHGTAGQGDVHLLFSSSVHAGNRLLHHVVLVARLAQELL